VAAGLADRCEVNLAYAIGVAEPVSIHVETFGTGKVDATVIEKALNEVFDFTPRAIIESLGLRAPIYRATSAYGHFGRKPAMQRSNGREYKQFAWEETNKIKDLQTAAKV
jgi:S-adenosylmethionine synthetase